jgi:cardiolipin synthase
MDILSEKAKQGVKVYVLYDAIGSILTNSNFFVQMMRRGINVAEFHPFAPWKPHWNWFKRNHRKILCVDNNIAFIGGFNITEYDAPKSLGGRGWKDTQIKIQGSAVHEVVQLFWESWERCGKNIPGLDINRTSQKPEDRSTGQPLPACPDDTSGGRQTTIPVVGESGVPAPTPHTVCSPPVPVCPRGVSHHPMVGETHTPTYVSVVSASGIKNVRSIRRTYKFAIDRAKKYIHITNAYFLPDRLIYRRLIRAVRRGVDVSIITPFQTDHPYVRWASWSLFPHLIKNGIKIYEWQGEILHSKSAVIDGIWSSIGSHNLDHRSLHYNLELNINVFDREFASQVENLFQEDLKGSKSLGIMDCRSRQMLSKLTSKVLYLFRSWL